MKKALLLVMSFATYGLQAQVGINTTEPQSTLDVNGDVRIQSTVDSKIPSNEKCPCFLVVDENGIVKRISIKEWAGSLPGSGSSSGSGSDGTTIIGGVSPENGGVANPYVLTPDEVIELDWTTYDSNERTVKLSVNLPAGVPYSAYMSPTMEIPAINQSKRLVSITYPKGTTDGTKKITATVLFDDAYVPKLKFNEGDVETFEIPLYFNGIKQTKKFILRSGLNAVKNTEHNKEFIYPVVKIGNKYITAMNLGAKYAELAKDNLDVLKEWRGNQEWRKDYKAFGSLFQWGRDADGHELINWNSSTSGTPVNPSIVWKKNNQLSSLSNNQWACPQGWHVPSRGEWEDIRSKVKNLVPGPQKQKALLNYRPLSTVIGGWRRDSNGRFEYNFGILWSSTKDETSGTPVAVYADQVENGQIGASLPAHGFGIRCLKN